MTSTMTIITLDLTAKYQLNCRCNQQKPGKHTIYVTSSYSYFHSFC